MPAMKLPKVTVGVIVFKETKYLPWSLTSLLDQDYPEVEYIIRDHSPNGEVFHWLKENHPEIFQKAKISIEDNGAMHSGGHNAMIRQMLEAGREVYFCVSNDMLYPKDFVSKIIQTMREEKTHVATCKLMRWDFEKTQAGDLEASKTDYVDSFGIGLTKGHQFFDQGQGILEKDFHFDHKILGPSGAVAVFDQAALESIAYKNKQGKIEYFDENLYYKNDCDLSYRLSWAGFKCSVADVKVYHDRQLGEKSKGVIPKLKEHHQKVAWAKESSLFGHLVALKKNFDPTFSFSVKLRTGLSQLVRYLYTLFFTPKMLHTYKKVGLIQAGIDHRKKQMKKTVSAREIEMLMT